MTDENVATESTADADEQGESIVELLSQPAPTTPRGEFRHRHSDLDPVPLARKRELFHVAEEVAAVLEKHDVRGGETCVLRNFVETLFYDHYR